MNRVKDGVSLWEHWYDVFFRPSDAMRAIAAEQHKGRAAVTLIVSLLPLWAVYFAIRQDLSVMAAVLFVLHVAIELIIWPCLTALLHLIASLAGGRGEAVGLFCAFGYAGLPHLYFVPLAAVAQCLPRPIAIVALTCALAAMAAWTTCLKVLALRECYGFSAAKSILVFISPLLLLLLGAALTAVLLSSAVLSAVFG